MQLETKFVNGLVDDLSLRLGGAIVKLYGTARDGQTDLLCTVKLRTPAFEPAINGRAQVLPLEPVRVEKSGDAMSATILTAAGERVATLTVAEAGTEAAREADIVLDRIDFSRDGLFTIQAWSLRLPATS